MPLEDKKADAPEPSDLGTEAEREWHALRQLLEGIKGDVAHGQDCGAAERTLARVSSVRGALDRLEHALQTAHLACCILPGVQVPAELALALARLSAQRIGALVVVEQQGSLDAHIAKGTPLDAQVSASLLESLFFPGSALHDGAAIVRGARIMAAGVFLPLTAERRDPVHGRLLGARHRAALGITSASDAVAFVVSEESGHIAVAHHGLLHHAVPIDAMLGSDRGASGAPPPSGAPRPERSWWQRLRRRWRSHGRGRGEQKTHEIGRGGVVAMGTVPRLVSVLVACAAVLLPARAPATENMTVLFQDDFERGISARWVERGFPSIARKNVFSLGLEPGGNHYLRVTSRDSYSGKGVYLRFSVERCPTVRWRWIVSNVVAAGDLRRRDGDDAAAKLYVVFTGPSWWNPLDKRVLVYLWDNTAAKGTVLPNVWMPDRARMIVLESGRANVGGWVTEQVDLAANFARAFPGERPGDVEGVAFLADTDNTHAHLWAGLDDLEIRCTHGGSAAPR